VPRYRAPCRRRSCGELTQPFVLAPFELTAPAAPSCQPVPLNDAAPLVARPLFCLGPDAGLSPFVRKPHSSIRKTMPVLAAPTIQNTRDPGQPMSKLEAIFPGRLFALPSMTGITPERPACQVRIIGGTCLSGPLSTLDDPLPFTGHDKRAPPERRLEGCACRVRFLSEGPACQVRKSCPAFCGGHDKGPPPGQFMNCPGNT